MKLSRRKFIFYAGLTSVGAIGAISSLPTLLRFKNEKLGVTRTKNNLTGSTLNLNASTLENLSSFTGTLFGRQLSQLDSLELSEIFQYTVTHDNSWAPEYLWFSTYINRLSNEKAQSNFSSLSLKHKEEVLVTVVSYSVKSTKSKVFALFSENERNLRKMALSTIPQLTKLYKNSNTPWRSRAYNTWPGVPGDPREYTKPGKIVRC